MAGLHRNMTLLDICCGSGAIGLSLASNVGNVSRDFLFLFLSYVSCFIVACFQVLGVDNGKYKRDYDAYTEWYNKYSTLYAAKQEKLTKSASIVSSSSSVTQTEDKLPDPNAVPPGVDPVAWRKYCNDTRDYYHKYKAPQAQAVASTSTITGGLGFDSKKSVAEQMADEILRKRGLIGKF